MTRMAQRPRRSQRSPAFWLAGAVLLILLGYALAARSTAEQQSVAPAPAALDGAASTPMPTVTPSAEPAEVVLSELVAGTATVEEGPFTLDADEDELTDVIRDGLAQSGTPVDDLEIALLDHDDGGLMSFDAVLLNGVPISGQIALEIVEGQLEPEVTEASMGGISLPGFATGIVDELLGQATSLGDNLADQGVVISDLSTGDGQLSIVGEKT